MQNPSAITRNVVAQLDQATRFEWLRRILPDFMFDAPVLLMNWQWVAIGIVLFVGVVLDRTVVFALVRVIRRLLHGVDLDMNPKTLRGLLRPVGILAMALFWLAILPAIGLHRGAHDVLKIAATFVAATAGVWGLYRLVDIATEFLHARASRTESRYDDLLVPLISKTAKIFILAFGLVFVAGNLDIDISSLLAGLGLGGLAFALAAKDTVSNLFGTLTIVLDRPFQVGDWVVIGDTEGTVEKVGFRSSRVRTFYNSLITVPNGTLLTATVDNLGVRRYRRFKTNLSLTYDTPPDTIDAFCEGVRELIRQHPYTRKDYFHVYLNGMAASSLDVLLYTFFEVPDWATELRERHRLIGDILRLADRLGVSFAFPTQTLHLTRADAPNPMDGDSMNGDPGSGDARRAARAIAEAGLGGAGVVPPPVASQVSAKENRGESGGGE